MCPLVAAVLRPAGVHISSHFPAGMVVSTVAARNLSPFARWRCRSSPCRRAFFILFPRRRDRFDDGSEEFATMCPLAAGVLRFAGVHFLFCFPAGMVVSTQGAVNFATLCPLAAAVLRHAGVHISSHFPAGMAVSTVPAGN